MIFRGVYAAIRNRKIISGQIPEGTDRDCHAGVCRLREQACFGCRKRRFHSEAVLCRGGCSTSIGFEKTNVSVMQSPS